ncbi:MAG: LLM class flavin-dependent oxidoreductase [Microthrixaceae bacterium]|nr:LLM class flavin-dependent oxidoreductase [Microthrixaceae bacterium]
MGRGELLAEMWRLWGEGDRKAALEAIPESLVDELIVSGTPEECREAHRPLRRSWGDHDRAGAPSFRAGPTPGAA